MNDQQIMKINYYVKIIVIIIVSSDYSNLPHSYIFTHGILTQFMPKKKILTQLIRHTYILLREGNYW